MANQRAVFRYDKGFIVDFIPYGRQTIDSSDIETVIEALKSDYLTTGERVSKFEEAIASYCGAKYCVAVSSGTGALHIASLSILNRGDRVLTTPNSFLATANSIIYAGAKPIFVDIAKDGNIDLEWVEEQLRIDPSIEGLYGVSFSGNMLNQDRLKEIREKYNIIILEDNAHSIGATYRGVKAGSCINSDVSIFSFHPVKGITTGEGGAITTNSREIYERLLTLRNHGIVKSADMKPWEYEMRELGFNYRLTDIQSALGLSQLKRLDEFIIKRRAIAKRYDEAFRGTIIKPLYRYNPDSAYHLYVVKVDFDKLAISREELFIKMRERNIGLQLHYIPINRQPYYIKLGYGDEVNSNMYRYYKQAFSLPIYPLLSSSEQEFVIESLFEVLNVK